MGTRAAIVLRALPASSNRSDREVCGSRLGQNHANQVIYFTAHYGRSVLTGDYQSSILFEMKAAINNDPAVAVAYIRVSTDDQNLGPDAQRASIAAWAARQGVRVVVWCIDKGVSGGKPVEDRPALLEALEAVRGRHAGLLVAAKRPYRARRCRRGDR
jgi:hypothetical protein